MPASRLTALQAHVLETLARAGGGWTLTGGAALAGFHTRHRTTRDLDLFWRARTEIAGARDEVLALLRAAGLHVDVLQSEPALGRLRVEDGGETLVVDLVADPVAAIEPPTRVDLGGRALRVDSPHEILVNKLCALLQRSELRDLTDVEALLETGLDLERALRDAPRKDGGFSPLTLIRVLRSLSIEAMARASGAPGPDTARALTFRDLLVARIASLARPGR